MSVTHSADFESTSSQYASIANGSCPNLEITGSQTWECWVKPESFANNKRFMGKVNNDFSAYRLLYQLADASVIFVIIGLSDTVGLGAGALVAGVWQHLAGVYDATAGEMYLYINGELKDQATVTGTISAVTGTGQFAVGSDGVSGHSDGLIRNARVWNVARTQAQIRADMNVDTPSDTTGIQGNWILNNAYTDSSGNGYTLTASGSPTFATVYPDALDLTENGTYLKKHKITIDNTKVSGSSDLTDFPIVLTEDNFLADAFSNSLNGGADIRFSTDIDGKVRLAHEIVTWNTGTSVAEVHVKVNTLSYNTDTDIYVHYGNSSAVAIDENEAFGKHQTWPSNYKAVYHLVETANTTAGGYLDSTRNDGNSTGTSTDTNETGKIGQAQNFDGTNDYITLDATDFPAGSTARTILMWVNPDIVNRDYQAFLEYGTRSVDAGILFSTGAGAGNQAKLGVGDYGENAALSTGTISADTWQFIGFTLSSGTVTYYINGAASGTGSLTSTNTSGTGGYIGEGWNASDRLDGGVQQIIVYSGALSADYIATLYNNQNSPSTFAVPVSGFIPKVIFI